MELSAPWCEFQGLSTLANLKCAYFRNTVLWNSQTHEAFLCFETCHESLPCSDRTSTFGRLAPVLKCIAGCLQLLGIHLIGSNSKSSIVTCVMSIFLLNLHVVNRHSLCSAAVARILTITNANIGDDHLAAGLAGMTSLQVVSFPFWKPERLLGSHTASGNTACGNRALPAQRWAGMAASTADSTFKTCAASHSSCPLPQ